MLALPFSFFIRRPRVGHYGGNTPPIEWLHERTICEVKAWRIIEEVLIL